MGDNHEVKERQPLHDTLRTLEFWRRASGVYVAYKGAQARAAFLSKARRWDADRLKEEFWKPHHTWLVLQSFVSTLLWYLPDCLLILEAISADLCACCIFPLYAGQGRSFTLWQWTSEAFI